MSTLMLNLAIAILFATLVLGNDVLVCKTVKFPEDAKANKNCDNSTIYISDGSSVKGQKGEKGAQGLPGKDGAQGKGSSVELNQVKVNQNGYLQCVNTCVNGKCTKTGTAFKCVCFAGFTGSTCSKETLFSNCQDVSKSGFTKSKVYPISLIARPIPIQAYCDMTSAGGGWLVIMRRMDGIVNFYRNWKDFRFGFGNLYNEFWLGLDSMNILTSSKSYQLRVDIEDFDGKKAYALYKTFKVGNADSKYVLTVGGYSGTAGDALKYQNKMKFSTLDSDNDNWPGGKCTSDWHSAGWFNKCLEANLNGNFMPKGTVSARSITWLTWKKKFSSLKKAEMKIKPN